MDSDFRVKSLGRRGEEGTAPGLPLLCWYWNTGTGEWREGPGWDVAIATSMSTVLASVCLP